MKTRFHVQESKAKLTDEGRLNRDIQSLGVQCPTRDRRLYAGLGRQKKAAGDTCWMGRNFERRPQPHAVEAVISIPGRRIKKARRVVSMPPDRVYKGAVVSLGRLQVSRTAGDRVGRGD
jgi:hypothetical protein